MNSEIKLCLLSIEQAHGNYGWSDDDLETLRKLYEHAILYSCLLEHDSLCNEKNLVMISGFCRLVVGALPPPDIKNGVTLSLKRTADGDGNKAMKLGANVRALAAKMYQEVIVEFMSVFQVAILDLSSQLKDAGQLSGKDAENAHYVIGMAEITLTNVQSAFERNGEFNESDYSNINKFFVDSTRYAAALSEREINFA